MPTTIDSLELQIKSSSSEAVKGIDSLTASLGKLKTATKGGIGLTSVVNQLNKTDDAVKNVENSGFEKLDKLGESLNKITSIKKTGIFGSIARGITKIGDAINNLTSPGVENLKDITNSVEHLSSFKNVQIPTITQPTDGVSASAPDTSSVGNGAQGISDAVDAVNRYNQSMGQAQEQTKYWSSQLARCLSNAKAEYVSMGASIKNAFSGIAEKIQWVKNGIVNLPSNILKGFATIPVKIGKAFVFAASKIKGLGSKLKEVASSKIKGGLENIGNKIKSLGRHSGAAKGKLGQLFSSMKRIAMYRLIRSFFAQLTGAMKEGINNLYHYSNAMGGTFAGSMDRLATSFQYLKNSMGAMVSPIINALAPALDFVIDKFVALLNLMNQFFSRLTGASTFTAAKKQAKSYGGAISGAGGAAKKAAKEIKDATIGIDELNIISQPDDTPSSGGGGAGGSGADYGSMFEELPIDNAISDFADKLKAAFEEGDWKELGTLLGTKFNEMIDNIPWSQIGHKIGYALNGAVQSAYWFLKTTDFKNLGNHIAENLTASLEEIDFTVVGRLFVRGFTSAIDLLMGFLDGLDWGLVGKSVGDGLRGALDEGREWLDSVDWSQMAHSIWTHFKECIAGIDFASLASSLFMFLGTALGSFVYLIASFVGEVVHDIGQYFLKYITNEDGIRKSGWELIAGIFAGIWDAIKNIGTWIKENIFDPFIDGFKNIFGIHSPSTVMMEYGGMIVKGLYEGIKNLIGSGIEIITGWAKGVFDWFTGGDGNGNIFQKFGNAAKGIVDSFGEKVSGVYTSVKNKITTWGSGVYNWFTGGDGNGNIFQKFGNAAKGIVDSFGDKVGNVYTTVKDKVTTWGSGVYNWFTGGDGNGNIFEKFGNAASNIVSGFKDKVGNSYTGTKSNITTWASKVKSWFADGSYGGVNGSTFSTYANAVIDGFKNKVGNAYTNAKSNMETFANKVKGWFTDKVSYDKFRSVASDVVDGFKNGIGAFYNTCKSTISSWGSSIVGWFKEKLDSHSPSKVFMRIGQDSVLGYNIGLEKYGNKTKGIVNKWADSFTNTQPQLAYAFAVDTSALDYYDSDDYMRSIQSNVNTRNTFTVTGFKEGMEEFYKEYVEPTISRMADDVRRQADKQEKTIVQVGNKVVSDAVTIQKNADGYSFIK